MKCEDVTVEQFMQAWFNYDFRYITKDEFDIVYAEYIDLSGLYQSREFELFAYIEYLKNRIFVLRTVFETQNLYIDTFNEPYVEGFFIFDSFGYKVNWNGDVKNFKQQLDRISAKERVRQTELKRKEFEFEELKKAKSENDVSAVQSRHDFIRMLNSFNKAGYKIDKKQTTVEELALMIKQSHDEYEEFKMQQLNR